MLPDNFWIMQAPVLSTIHISKETNDWLAENCDGANTSISIHDIDGGWLVYSSDIDALESLEIPEDLKACLRWNINNEYEWLRLDQDGGQVDDLPKFDW